MPAVLTRAAAIRCPHPPGQVALPPLPPAPAPKLTVRGTAVLVKADLATALITGCPQPVQTVDLKVGTITAGEALKLTVKTAAVLLDTTFAATSDKGAALALGGGGQTKVTST